MSIQTILLPAGQILTVTAPASHGASVYRLRAPGEGDPYTPVAVLAGASSSVGPFAESRSYAVDCEGVATYVVSTPEPVSDGDTVVNLVLTTPDINGGTADALTSLSLVNDVLFLTGAGVPVDYTDGTPPATGEGTAGIGSMYIDRTNGKFYVNGGTKAEPIWKLVTSAA